MNPTLPGPRNGRYVPVFLTAVLAVAVMLTATVQAQVPLVKLSTDTFTNPSSQHATEVEPDTYAFGSTIVAAFQVGRIFGGGSSDIGFATSTDGGAHWTNGFLPGVTQFFMGGRFSAASDPSVAFDAAHGVWLISSLGLAGTNNVLTSRSTDGISWENPVVVDDTSGFADKNWIACDSSASSPFFGHCYVEWDDAADGGRIRMSTSTDGGLTWSSPISPPNAFGLGGQPVVQPNGRVVVPYTGNGLQAFSSNNGGASWTSPVTVSNIVEHGVAGGLRTFALASAEVDGGGTVYVVWQDCRFRSNCSSNDIVMSTSTNGTTWTPPARIPIDPTSSTVDHFIPGISADPATSGSTAQLALTYYFYPRARCTPVTCKLAVGFVSSQDGGQTWSAAIRVAGPMKTTWLPQTSSGLMVGDYISTSFVNGKAFGVFAKANRRVGQVFDSAMYTTVDGFSIPAGGPVFSSAGENPVPGVKSDRGPRKFYDLDGRIPIPPPKPN